MKKIDGLEELWRWVLNTNSCLLQNQPLMFQQRDVNRVFNLSTAVSNAIKDDYPFYADELPQIVMNTFQQMGGGFYGLNTAAFGELFIITKHLHNEPQDASVWTMIHPRILAIAKEEYLDGHYASAANRSFVEVETRLRELFVELKPSATVPAKVGDIIGACEVMVKNYTAVQNDVNLNVSSEEFNRKESNDGIEDKTESIHSIFCCGHKNCLLTGGGWNC